MLIRMKWFAVFSLCCMLITGNLTVDAADGVRVYTPFTKISVPPGESIDYTIDVFNNSSELQNVEISVTGMPSGWNYLIKSGSWNIRQIAILPGEKKSFSLHVEVPFQVNKGSYRFRVNAVGFSSLPLTVVVSEQGTFKTEFLTRQPNMEGHANATFTFNAELKNRTADKQLYALIARAPRGWAVTFKANYKQVTSVEAEANSTTNITMDINPPDNIKAGAYKIPVTATTSATSATLELEVVITGSYTMELTTPRGLLSASITAGDEKRLELLVKNTGSAELKDIALSAGAPLNWDVTFDPKRVESLAPGENAQVFATIKADKKAIAGDYVTAIEARTPEVTAKASFRIAVKTPMLWGWIGVLIIVMAIVSIYYLFRKYGRR
ncbi:MAG: hypothetical protein JW973_18490 [Bacteroidales bacterium]|nr:hypothetical protein [Bacteroidales bacterium]